MVKMIKILWLVMIKYKNIQKFRMNLGYFGYLQIGKFRV